MKKKMYHLAHCTTCQAIIKETGADLAGIEFQTVRRRVVPELLTVHLVGVVTALDLAIVFL